MTPVEWLAQVPLFAMTSVASRERLVAGARRLSLEKNGLLFYQGEPGQELYLVLSGVLEVVRETDGEKLTLALVQAGGVVGEMAVLDSGPRSAAARALENTELLGISQAAFQTVVRAEPELALELLRSMAVALRRTNQQAAALAHQDVYTRLVNHLHALCASHGKSGEGGVLLDLPLSDSVLGQSIGSEPAGVRILLDVLLFDGVLAREGDRYRVPDPERLLGDEFRVSRY